MPKGQICIFFNDVPPNTHFTKGSHSWVFEAEAKGYIESGFGLEYDPNEKKKSESPPKPKIDIPNDFPGRDHFLEAGIETMAKINKMKDYDSISGIGQSIEQKIVEYLKKK